MITKINATTPLKYNYNKHISFKSYNTKVDNINIDSGEINKPVRSMAGNIYINNATVKKPVSNISGSVHIEDAKVDGSIENVSGPIEVSSSWVNGSLRSTTGLININNDSAIIGDVSSSGGSIAVENSVIHGNVGNSEGKVVLNNSTINGEIEVKPENIQFKGENIIKTLVLKGNKELTPEEEAVIDYLKTFNIHVGGIGKISINGANIENTFIGGKLVSTTSHGKKSESPVHKSSSEKKAEKPLKFRLPEGVFINTIKFDAKKKGTLIIEEGAEFLGKVIHGKVIRL